MLIGISTGVMLKTKLFLKFSLKNISKDCSMDGSTVILVAALKEGIHAKVM